MEFLTTCLRGTINKKEYLLFDDIISKKFNSNRDNQPVSLLKLVFHKSQGNKIETLINMKVDGEKINVKPTLENLYSITNGRMVRIKFAFTPILYIDEEGTYMLKNELTFLNIKIKEAKIYPEINSNLINSDEEEEE